MLLWMNGFGGKLEIYLTTHNVHAFSLKAVCVPIPVKRWHLPGSHFCNFSSIYLSFVHLGMYLNFSSVCSPNRYIEESTLKNVFCKIYAVSCCVESEDHVCCYYVSYSVLFLERNVEAFFLTLNSFKIFQIILKNCVR